MTRRIFILLTFYMFTKSLSAKNMSPKYWQIIEVTLNHLFPKTNQYFGSSKLNFINFFKLISNDKYFDKEDLKLLLNGAKKLYKLNNNYLDLSKERKEILLRKFEQSSIGQSWLSILIYYGLEAMLSDPIYGGNKNTNGWQALNHNPGVPRPKIKYGKNNV